MSRDSHISLTPKVVRRLAAAEGYLQLGMPAYALDELDRIEGAGPLESSAQFLRGEALRMTGDYQVASAHLEKAARTLPAPLRFLAWQALADCYRQMGHDALADFAEAIVSDAAGDAELAEAEEAEIRGEFADLEQPRG